MATPNMCDNSRTWSCAACTTTDKICMPDCVFASLFPPERTTQFVMVHKVFGEVNSRKLLNKLPPEHRNDAADSLVYEAEARLRDPLHGCIGKISSLQRRLKRLKEELAAAEADLSHYMGMIPGTFDWGADHSSSADGNGNANKNNI